MSIINRRWLPLNALRAFDAVGTQLSFTGGAQALHVSQSALSRHVISLEELLGKKLLERRPQHLVLTPEGAALLPVVQKAFDRLEQTLNTIKDGEKAGRTLRVHMPPSLLNQMALPMLQDFRREFPDVQIDVSSSHVTGLPAHELDVAVVYDRPNVDDRVTDLLWMVRTTPVCSPEVARTIGGRDITAFLGGQELLHVKLDDKPRGFLWANFLRQCGGAADTERGSPSTPRSPPCSTPWRAAAWRWPTSTCSPPRSAPAASWRRSTASTRRATATTSSSTRKTCPTRCCRCSAPG